ncbi:hypothetical protein E2C01_042049 [Portunus trituberculatus]|uniref:Uncharacterized protein n=1 Tax=Portunus trituberculatus TaxID=210409 RepID=A0A5B7FKR8_PORTR|nr:hypothetical protein [Portunus trituberculatus]
MCCASPHCQLLRRHRTVKMSIRDSAQPSLFSHDPEWVYLWCCCEVRTSAVLRRDLFTCPAMSRSPSLDGYSTDTDRTTPVLSSTRSQSKAKEVYQTSRRESGRSKPSAPSEASSGDRHSAPLAMVMDTITELRYDMEKLKKDRPAVSTEDNKFEGSAPVPHKSLESVSQASPAGFSGFSSPVSVDSNEGEEFQGAVFCGIVLLEGTKNFGPTESVSEKLEKEIAAMVNHLFISGMRKEDYKAVMEDEVTLTPSNYHALTQVECNAQVLDALPAEARFSGGCQKGFFGKGPSHGFSSRFQPYDSRRSTVRGDPRRSYPSVVSTSKNLRGRGGASNNDGHQIDGLSTVRTLLGARGVSDEGYGKAFPLQKDYGKKAANLAGVGHLVSMKSTQQLVVRSSKAYLMGKATSSRSVIY